MRDLQSASQHRGLWPIDYRYLRAVTLKTLVYADDVKIRWLMALSSLGWTAMIAITPEMFQRPYFASMAELASPVVWAVLFAFHGLGAIWRIYDRTERMAWALVVNGAGLVVWLAADVCTNMSVEHHFSAANILETLACLFLLGVFTATGFASKSTTA